MDDEPLKDAYWAIVSECLARFHGFDPGEAVSLANDLRARIERSGVRGDPPPGYDSRYFYHSEPFHVACDLAKTRLDLEGRWDEYDAIADRHYAAVGDELQPDTRGSYARTS